MSQKALDRFMAAGAESVGGTVYLNRVEVGKFEADGFVLTEAGQATAELPVPVADVASADAPTGRKSRSTKAAAADITAESDILAGLGNFDE